MKTFINSLHELEALNIENEYTKRNLAIQWALKVELSALVPCLFEYDSENQSADLWLDYDERIGLHSNHNGFSIFSWKHFSTVDVYKKSSLEKTLEAPNNFKILNKKTILVWIEHYKKLNALCAIVEAENVSKATEYMARIATLEAKGLKHTKTKDGKGGWLSSKYFELIYQIQSNGYIDQKIIFTPQTDGTLAFFETLVSLESL